ncbi:unnamed protein product [Phytophthora fragariaefolia]|uniref:Unnamed protein product n=1 Tax=Phytophthora fragariaefolia TaxID=1490495 RepID=A0A9W6U8Q7_9STRA|nr:unnamed protein product [Phytophthora fragariaefolia]
MAFPKTYRAYHQYENYGLLENELKIHDNVPQKTLGAQQVRIKVRSATVNPIDYVLQEGLGQAFTGKTPSEMEPFDIGFDVSGDLTPARLRSGLVDGDSSRCTLIMAEALEAADTAAAALTVDARVANRSLGGTVPALYGSRGQRLVGKPRYTLQQAA